jgi:S-adenosylmethionine:tRNA ribosyltransferase-isomerase
MLKLTDFDYDLPLELIAQEALEHRQKARLLVVDRNRSTLEHLLFEDLPRFFNKNDLIVLNDSKVLPCRLIGKRKTGGRTEIFLLKNLGAMKFRALLSPGRLKKQERVIFEGSPITALIIDKETVEFDANDLNSIYALGVVPLPPYIKREARDSDKINYQTVYARIPGSVASPTAGLHFTDGLLGQLKQSGKRIAYVTLHVGLGTFKPVKCDDITQHKMEEEEFSISQESIKLIEEAKLSGNMIVATGTTSLRVLETYALGKSKGMTGLFVYPGYDFKLVNALITNFHLPCSTLFMLACAFGTEKLIKKAYKEAIEKKYRFYSYGDAMLII